MTLSTAMICNEDSCTAFNPSMPFDEAGKVVTNCCVGFGAPEMVTVGAPAAGEGELELLESEIAKDCDEA